MKEMRQMYTDKKELVSASTQTLQMETIHVKEMWENANLMILMILGTNFIGLKILTFVALQHLAVRTQNNILSIYSIKLMHFLTLLFLRLHGDRGYWCEWFL